MQVDLCRSVPSTRTAFKMQFLDTSVADISKISSDAADKKLRFPEFYSEPIFGQFYSDLSFP